MALVRSPMRTRSQAAALASDEGASRATEREDTSATTGPTPETVEQGLQILMSELREMREEQARLRGEFTEVLRRCDEGCQQQREVQLSPFINRSCRAAEPSVAVAGPSVSGEVNSRVELGLKLKLDTYDGSSSLREYLSQFELIARANLWNEASKTVALASSLRGRARSVLEAVENLENVTFNELKFKLELRFGEGSSRNFYMLFTNRKQKFGEDFASFGMELERLARLAYPECPFSVRDKISCAQFVSAVSDGFVRRTLQLEGVTSLVSAIERAKAVKAIQEENFGRERERNFNGDVRQFSSNRRNFVSRNFEAKRPEMNRRQNFKSNSSFGKFENSRGECWTFSGGMSGFRIWGAEKLGFAEWNGGGSATRKESPTYLRINRVCKDVFCFKGMLDGEHCNFKIDTGSDVSIISSKFVKDSKEVFPIENNRLIYPTGEMVPVHYKTNVKVNLGKFSVDLSVFIADMREDCLLGNDFLSFVNLESCLRSILGVSQPENDKSDFVYARAINRNIVPSFLSELFERDSINLSASQKEVFSKLLFEFQDIFSEEIVAGSCDVLEHGIELNDSRPIKQAPRRVPIHLRANTDKIIAEMKEKGVIEESQSPWVSPAVLVRKKDGSIRFCVDFRKLNLVTKKDSFPIPRIDDTIDQLSGNSWFSTLDLKSGYWQIKLRPEDREKTAFSIGKGLWQFTVLPFGLCNAPATFQRLMEQVLQKFLYKFCLVYLDDVIIYSKTFESMIERLKAVFLQLRTVNLKLNPKKCVLLGNSVKYLGHVVSNEGISKDPEKISAVSDWPIPQTKKQLRSFLGFCSYYRKFVKGFSLIAKPLFVLTENQSKFIWSSQCQEAFEKLKQSLIASSILSFPLEHGELILDTDASNFGIGAVLSQIQEGQEKVIAYFSRVLSKSERNYCTTRRELLAIIESIKSFHHYLYGRKFLIRTDHASLKWIMSFKDLEGQLARWMERLQQYDFEICYRKGLLHSNADGLSRRPCVEDNCKYCSKIEVYSEEKKEKEVVARILLGKNIDVDWRKEQLEDRSISIILRGLESGQRPTLNEISSGGLSSKIYLSYWDNLVIRDGVLYKKWEASNLKSNFLQIIVPGSRVKQILIEAHDSPSGGHFGINKTLEKIRKRFYWATCKRDVENWVRSCKVCVSKRGPSDKGKSPLQIYNVGTPFERLQMDILGPLPLSSSGNKYLLVVVDCFTKWVEAFPLKNIRASSVAEVFVNEVVSRHGVPLELHTDQGRNFESKLFMELSRLLGFKKTRTTAFHPQSDGQVERQHQTILQYLSKFISENQKDWDRWISMFLLAYRTSRHETTGFSPAELYFGQDLRLPIDLLRGSPPVIDCDELSENYVFNLREKLDQIHQHVRQFMTIKSNRVKAFYDQKARNLSFEAGQKVWLHNPRRSKGKAPKLQNFWEGPYEVVKKISDVVYCIRKSKRHKNKVVHLDRLASFYGRD